MASSQVLPLFQFLPARQSRRGGCYHCGVFQFGRPKTAGQWIAHIVGVIIALFLVWWMLRVFVF
jgi:hypothetical protein